MRKNGRRTRRNLASLSWQMLFDMAWHTRAMGGVWPDENGPGLTETIKRLAAEMDERERAAMRPGA